MSEENGRDLKLTEFDYMMADPHRQMMKAAIPYLQPPQQRMISMMIKIQELQKTRSMFRDGEVSAMGLSAPAKQKASPMELLLVIKPYANPREREMIEMLENLQIMMQAMQSPT